MGSRVQLAHAALVVVGLALLAGGVFVLDQPAYTHEVETVSEESVSGDRAAVNYSALSPEGRAMVREAVGSADGRAVAGTDSRLPDFVYDDAAGDHFVRYEGESLRVTTDGGGTLSAVDEIVAWVLLAFGGLAVLVGGIDLYRHRGAGE